MKKLLLFFSLALFLSIVSGCSGTKKEEIISFSLADHLLYSKWRISGTPYSGSPDTNYDMPNNSFIEEIKQGIDDNILEKWTAEECIYNNELNRKFTIYCMSDSLIINYTICINLSISNMFYNKKCDDAYVSCNKWWYVGELKTKCITQKIK